MARVYIPTQLRAFTRGIGDLTLSGGNVAALVAELEERFPGIADRLLEDGDLARGLAVSIDGQLSPRGALALVGEQSEVHFLPAIGGG